MYMEEGFYLYSGVYKYSYAISRMVSNELKKITDITPNTKYLIFFFILLYTIVGIFYFTSIYISC